MNSIHVLTDNLPKNGHQLICDYYNSHKPSTDMPLCKVGVAEGGVEIGLNDSELTILKDKFGSLGPNQKVLQLRWSLGWLISMGHIGLFEHEVQLLLRSLNNVLGEYKVEYKPYVYNNTWWESPLD